ncbi:MAG: hypothetical protein G01um101438_364 [Parcubacteria group bacterium Gr01-1014_38]|nr:MAG: hypothetical protein G01um101438_364 [Parcubacteria group bacterium Gr01-1014_38]
MEATIGANVPNRRVFPELPPPVKPPRVPARLLRRSRRLFLLVAGVVLLIGGGAAFVLLRSGGSLIDSIPSDAVAFVSVRPKAPGTGPVLSAVLGVIDGLRPEMVSGASDVTALLVRTDASPTPRPVVLLRGRSRVDLSAAPTLGVRRVRGGTLIAPHDVLAALPRRFDRPWGKDPKIRSRALRLDAGNAPVVIGLRFDTAPLLQPLFFQSLAHIGPALLALTPKETDPTTADVHIALDGDSRGQRSVPPRAFDIARNLPASAMFVLPLPGSFVSDIVDRDNVPDSLRPLVTALRERRDIVKGLRERISETVVFATLPSAGPRGSDGVAVLSLFSAEGIAELLRRLEPIANTFAPYVSGRPFPETPFTETVYQDVKVRYLNFGSPAQTVDYALVGDLLLLASSREAMFTLIDAMHSRAPTLGSQQAFNRLAAPAQQRPWAFLQPRTAQADERSSAFDRLLKAFQGIMLTMEDHGIWSGTALLAPPPSR